MPRISKFNGEYNDIMDFCNRCYPEAKRKYPLSEGYEHNIDAPPYDDWDYKCEICRKLLTDNNA